MMILADVFAWLAAALILSAMVTEFRRCFRDREAAVRLVLPRLTQQAAANALLAINCCLIGNWVVAATAAVSCLIVLATLFLGWQARRRG